MGLLDKRNVWILTYFFIDNEECNRQIFEEKIINKKSLIRSIQNCRDWELVDVLLNEQKIKNVFLYKGRYLCCLDRFVCEGYVARDRMYDYTIYDQEYFLNKFQIKEVDIVEIQVVKDKSKNLLGRIFNRSLFAMDLKTEIIE
ncbi:hypothetical protein [Labilibaculum euxinus]